MEDKIVSSVVDKFKERSERGQQKYGTTLERGDLTLVEWMTHIQEELMDATLYIEKLRADLTNNPNFPDGHVITKESWEAAETIVHEGFVYVKYTDLLFYK